MTTATAEGRVRFRYRAATREGAVRDGVIDAASRDTAMAELRRRELYVMALEASRDDGRTTVPGGGTRDSLPLWTRTLATLLGGGARLDDALDFLSGETRLGRVAAQLGAAVRSGSSLAAALRTHPREFPPLFVALVAVGEETGALPSVLERLAVHLEEGEERRDALRTALVYPVLLALGTGVGVSVLLLFVLPRFSEMLRDLGGTLPASTRALVAVSRFAAATWWIWLVAFIALATWGRSALRDAARRRRIDAWRLRIPWLAAAERAWVTARVTRTLGLMLRDGVAILPALRIARSAVTNAVVAEQLEEAERAVAAGMPLSDALAPAVSPLGVRLLAVGERSGRLPEVCARIADASEAELRRTSRLLIAVLEPAMVLLFAGIVGFVALAMLQAIYSVNAHAF